MTAQKPQRPQNMGQVFERFAAALKDERKRGIPRFEPQQIERIERVVHTLAPTSNTASPTMEERRHAASPPPSKAGNKGGASTQQKPADAASRAPRPRVEKEAPQKQRPRPGAASPPQTSTPKPAPATPSPQHSDATPPEQHLPWMIDEAKAARRAAAAKTAPKPAARTQPASAANAPKDAEKTLQQIRAELGDCTRCGLCETRTNIVFGSGNPNAKLFLIGEAPSQQDDASGQPFSDEAGELLNNMLRAMTLDRNDVYSTHILKCHPPHNRAAQREELVTCAPFLRKQIEAVQPEVILALGSQASRLLLGARFPFAQKRGEWHTWESTLVMPTFHPSYLLQHPRAKAPAWKDLQKVMQKLGLS